MNPNNPVDEELMFEQARQIRAEEAQKTEERIAKASALTTEEKIGYILELEDEKEQLTQECEKLDDTNARLNAGKFKWTLSCIGSLIALSGAVYGLFMQNAEKKFYQEQNHLLEQDLRAAALLDEANSQCARAVFAQEVLLIGKERLDATPTACVDMAIKNIKEKKSQGNIALEDFQIRVIGQDLRVLAQTAQQTHTTTQNFLTAVWVYAQGKPQAYASSSTPVDQARGRIDNLLIKAGCQGR